MTKVTANTGNLKCVIGIAVRCNSLRFSKTRYFVTATGTTKGLISDAVESVFTSLYRWHAQTDCVAIQTLSVHLVVEAFSVNVCAAWFEFAFSTAQNQVLPKLIHPDDHSRRTSQYARHNAVARRQALGILFRRRN